MKRYYVERLPFSWEKPVRIKDSEMKTELTVKKEPLSWGQTLQFLDGANQVNVRLQQKVCGTVSRFTVMENEKEGLEITKQPGFRKPKYKFSEKEWNLKGNPSSHHYQLIYQNKVVAKARPVNIENKKLFLWEIVEDEQEFLAIGLMFLLNFILNSAESD